MKTKAYYRSSHPDVLAYWADTEARAEAFNAALKALEAEFPDSQACYLEGHGWREAYGLHYEQPHPAPGPGWMQKKGEQCWTADRRTKTGREVWNRLNDLRFNEGTPPGLPERVRTDMRFCFPGMERHGGDLWAIFSCTAAEVEACKQFNGSIWQPAKASEYWLAVEGEVRP
jgi:hypothetical protein